VYDVSLTAISHKVVIKSVSVITLLVFYPTNSLSREAWDNTPLFRKKSPVIKIYFPGNDTPTTNEGFSPSVVVVCHFQGRKFL
jgi:hypothetical protein